VALVVDPLRGAAKGRPEIGAFRCYPPAFTPQRGMAPDGEIWADEKARNARWGESCVSYYQLEVEYCLSSASAALMGTIARDFMWTRVLSSTAALDPENRDRVPERLHRLGDKVDAFELAAAAGGAGSSLSVMALGGPGAGAGGGARRVGASSSAAAVKSEIAEAATGAAELASELLRGQGAQRVKMTIFNGGAGSDKAQAELASMAALALQLDGKATLRA